MSWKGIACAMAVATLVVSPVAGKAPAPTPRDLVATFDPADGNVTLSWRAPNRPDATYLVWRDGILVGSTANQSFVDRPGEESAGFVYFVSASWPKREVSLPATAGVPTISCEVVNLGTSWDWPHVHVHLHEECLGITYAKDVTWTAP